MRPLLNRLALIALSSCALAACNQSQPERQFAQDPNSAVTNQFVSAGQTLSAPITTATIAPRDFAVLALPPDSRRGKMTEKQFANGWRQSLALAGGNVAGGWNDLSIEIMGAAPETPRPHLIKLYKPSAEGVRREIVSRFKGVPMRIVGRPMSNALGPFGLAVGAGPKGLRCAFAWQWVDNFPLAATGERPNFFNSGEMPASIRMRVCRRGVTADQLADWYAQLTVTDLANVARIVEAIPRNAPTEVAAASPAGETVVDSSDSLEATLIGGASPRAAAPPRRATRHVVRHGGRRYRAARSAAPEAPAPYAAPAALPSADGRQYLAPTTAAPLASAPAVRAGAPAIDPSLPARAYRGPSAPRAITPPTGGAPVYLGQ